MTPVNRPVKSQLAADERTRRGTRRRRVPALAAELQESLNRLMSVTSATDLGRKATQEDRIVAEQLELGSRDAWLLAVFDGHGGDEAAEHCAERLPEAMASSFSALRDPPAAIHRALGELAEFAATVERGGTTASVAIIDAGAGYAHIGVVGDSPVAVRRGDGALWASSRHHAAIRIEREHAIARGATFEKGYLFHRAADGTPDKDRGAIILTRSLGSRRYEFMDSAPEIESLELGVRSFVLVASDGLIVKNEHWFPDDFASFVAPKVSSGCVAEDLVRDAVEAGARDNVSAVLWTSDEMDSA